jgi:(S)-mandelate dehydrogenase
MTKLSDCLNIADLREAARRRLPRGVFEFLDRGTEDEISLAENRLAFQRLKLKTKFLVDLTQRDLGIDLLGKRQDLPLIIAPTGIAGLCWHEGELALAKAAATAGIPFTLTSSSLTAIDRIVQHAPGRLWFQLYMWREEELSYEMIARARDLGFEALVVTIDHALGRLREHNHRNGFTSPLSINRRFVTDMALHPGWVSQVMLRYLMTTGMPRHENFPAKYQHRITRGTPGEEPQRFEAMTWQDIAKLRRFWPRAFIVKGILNPEDARQAVENGADAIVVSNHGGRAMDSAVATIDILPEIVAAVRGRATIILDSGIRRGSDVMKAIALGAHAVMIGRATLYGISVAGQAGAERALSLLRNELEKNMAYAGCRTIGEITPDILAHRPSWDTAPARREAAE